jgi:hypothetical protein
VASIKRQIREAIAARLRLIDGATIPTWVPGFHNDGTPLAGMAWHSGQDLSADGRVGSGERFEPETIPSATVWFGTSISTRDGKPTRQAQRTSTWWVKAWVEVDSDEDDEKEGRLEDFAEDIEIIIEATKDGKKLDNSAVINVITSTTVFEGSTPDFDHLCGVLVQVTVHHRTSA